MNRRALLIRIVAGFSAVAIAGFSVPFLRSMLPSFDNDLSLDVDTGDMSVGDVRVVRWLGRNVLIIRREASAAKSLTGEDDNLQDPGSVADQQPAFARNPYRARKPEHLVVFANCTHLGCEVMVDRQNAFDGFSCPCHSSEFDIAGRVATGSAASLNLEVPDYHYVGRDTIRLRMVSDTTT